MGNLLASSVDENLKKNQDYINEMNTIKIERQLQMQAQMRERQIALEIAKSRELFFWFGAFYITSVAWTLVGYRRRKKLIVFSPLVPLSFIMAYQADLAYGNKTHRIITEAEHIMQFEPELLALPLAVPTVASLDIKRTENGEQKKLHPMLPPV